MAAEPTARGSKMPRWRPDKSPHPVAGSLCVVVTSEVLDGRPQLVRAHGPARRLAGTHGEKAREIFAHLITCVELFEVAVDTEALG